MDLLVWTAVIAGGAVAAMCVLFYAKGVRDGRNEKKGRQRIKPLPVRGGAEQTGEMGRKYEAILSYDPYAPAKNEGEEGKEGKA